MALTHAFILGFGALLIGIPILLHMLMQPKPKPLQFPALRFVRQMHSTNQRSLQLRHWLLLLLRCLLILALVAAFARPSTASSAFGNWLGFGGGALMSVLAGLLLLYALVWSRPANIPLALVVGAVLALALAWTGYTAASALSQNTKHVLADQQAPVASVLLVDSSPRMAYRSENQKLLQKVQDQGRWLISQLPLNSRIAVMETDGEQPFFSVDIGAARKRLNTMDINYASVPIPETLERAVDFLAETESERREIYIFSDLTRVSWANAGDTLEILLAEHPEISLFVIDVGVEDPTNFSLDELKLAATSIPARGELEIDTQIRATGPGNTLLVRMVLEKPDPTRPVRRDGKTLVPDKHWTRVTNIGVGDDSITSAKIVLQDDLEEGVHHGWVEIEGGDSLPEDDRRYFTIEVRPAWPVLVVCPPGVKPDNLVDVLETAGGMFDVRVIEQRQLAGEPMSDYNAIFLLNPEPITDPLWRLLQSYVDGGGGLGIFLGHNAADRQDPDISFRTDAAQEVLPGSLARNWRRRPGETLVLSIDNLAHPIAREFRPLASLGIWQPFPIHRHWELNTGFDANVGVIARFSNGVASVVERRIGAGKVICMT
ncbi:MAG: vWA domain-containing protein, partial [Pirellulaceae bacterium]